MAGSAFSHWIYKPGGKRIGVWKQRRLRLVPAHLRKRKLLVLSNPLQCGKGWAERLYLELYSKGQAGARGSAPACWWKKEAV